jgi:hypothetical protein
MKQALSSLSELMLSRPANIVLQVSLTNITDLGPKNLYFLSSAYFTHTINTHTNHNLPRALLVLPQDAWVTGCLPLATDAESSVQAKLAQCTYDLIINPSVAWAKKVQSSSPRLGRIVATSESELVWQLCNKISETGNAVWRPLCRILYVVYCAWYTPMYCHIVDFESFEYPMNMELILFLCMRILLCILLYLTILPSLYLLFHYAGGTKLLRTTIGIMLKQGILKAAPVCTDRGFEGTALAGKNSMSTVLQAVKTACCHGKIAIKSRSVGLLLYVLIMRCSCTYTHNSSSPHHELLLFRIWHTF